MQWSVMFSIKLCLTLFAVVHIPSESSSSCSCISGPSWVYGLVAVIELVWGRSDALHWKGIIVFSLKPVNFWIYYLGSAGFWTVLCSDERSFAQGEEERVFIAHAAVPYEKFPVSLVTLTFISFWPPSTVNHAVKIAHQHCVAVEKHCSNQHLVLACSYKNQSCFFFLKRVVATSPCQERRGIGGVFGVFQWTQVKWMMNELMLSAHRNAVVFGDELWMRNF